MSCGRASKLGHLLAMFPNMDPFVQLGSCVWHGRRLRTWNIGWGSGKWEAREGMPAGRRVGYWAPGKMRNGARSERLEATRDKLWLC